MNKLPGVGHQASGRDGPQGNGQAGPHGQSLCWPRTVAMLAYRAGPVDS